MAPYLLSIFKLRTETKGVTLLGKTQCQVTFSISKLKTHKWLIVNYAPSPEHEQMFHAKPIRPWQIWRRGKTGSGIGAPRTVSWSHDTASGSPPVSQQLLPFTNYVNGTFSEYGLNFFYNYWNGAPEIHFCWLSQWWGLRSGTYFSWYRPLI